VVLVKQRDERQGLQNLLRAWYNWYGSNTSVDPIVTNIDTSVSQSVVILLVSLNMIALKIMN
jgi:hypothetical protein